MAVFVTFLIAQFLGRDLPPFEFDLANQIRFFALFLFAGIGEEMGWTGFAFQRLLNNHNPLIAALIVSIIWMIWHLIPYIQTNRPPMWIAGQIIGSIFERLILFYFFLRMGRAVSLAILFHMMVNVAEFTYPINGSFYDAPIMAIVVAPFGIWAAWGLWHFRLKD